ncbi:unnamed protein product [Colletotrichum noveboracense]|uniref:Uncharacterized protein n=1 Tax=Colletotrichum noveboracense TaxID=2664923 RepID=A0A9W4RLE4_9PEZI|nr:unnamed protein product [Colletotrichum noveboracense]
MPNQEVGRYLDLLKRRLSTSTITGDEFQGFLEVYRQHISNPMLNLDTFRFETMPGVCRSRDPKYLKRNELIQLVKWMYSAGHRLVTRSHRRIPVAAEFNAAGLKRNRPEKVVGVTDEAFKIYAKDKNIPKAINCLMQLRGVGLTTATLILSTAYSDDIPFFSDALCNWVDPHNSRKDVTGYMKLVRTVDAVKRRVKSSLSRRRRITALDVEKVAFVVATSRCMRGI